MTAVWGLGGGGNLIGHSPREECQEMNLAPGSSFLALPPEWLSEKAQQKLNATLLRDCSHLLRPESSLLPVGGLLE